MGSFVWLKLAIPHLKSLPFNRLGSSDFWLRSRFCFLTVPANDRSFRLPFPTEPYRAARDLAQIRQRSSSAQSHNLFITYDFAFLENSCEFCSCDQGLAHAQPLRPGQPMRPLFSSFRNEPDRSCRAALGTRELLEQPRNRVGIVWPFWTISLQGSPCLHRGIHRNPPLRNLPASPRKTRGPGLTP